MVNFGLLAAEILSLVWGNPANFNGFRVLSALLHTTLVVGVSQTAAFNRGRHLYSAGRPSGWALAHFSSLQCYAFLHVTIVNYFYMVVWQKDRLMLLMWKLSYVWDCTEFLLVCDSDESRMSLLRSCRKVLPWETMCKQPHDDVLFKESKESVSKDRKF